MFSVGVYVPASCTFVVGNELILVALMSFTKTSRNRNLQFPSVRSSQRMIFRHFVPKLEAQAWKVHDIHVFLVAVVLLILGKIFMATRILISSIGILVECNFTRLRCQLFLPYLKVSIITD